jgi:hypothetical protein
LQFVKSTKTLLLSMLLMATACQTATKIPNVRFYAEIPFRDCPEGVFVDSLTKESGLISCDDWAKIRPLMIMIDPVGKKQIFGQWAETCRWAGQENCNVQLGSVKEVVEALDQIAGLVMRGQL